VNGLFNKLEHHTELVKLNNNNFVMIRGEINSQLASKFINDIQKIEEENIYVYISSPGGSVIDGFHMIEIIDALKLMNKSISCIAQNANSMAFAIFQTCSNRYILSSSILMQHQLSLTINGQYENIKTKLNLINSINELLLERQYKRINMNKDEFITKITSDWWIFGKNAIELNIADKIVNVICDKELINQTEKEELDLPLFGKIVLEFSKCPLVLYPNKIFSNSTN